MITTGFRIVGFGSLLAVATFIALPLACGSALASPSEHLNWGSQINRAQCPKGPVVIRVTQKVTNDFDSGTSGNNWALDDYVRHISVIKTGTGTYCATASYQGNFTTLAGPSPQNATSGGTVGAGVIGTFQGGYIATSFTGTLLSSPKARTRGSIGTFDYECDTDPSCPGYVDWTTLYFSSTSGFSLDWWGWIYHAGNNGSWVNSSSGNSGDITGN